MYFYKSKTLQLPKFDFVLLFPRYLQNTHNSLVTPWKLTRDPPTGRKFNVSYFKYQFYNYGWNATMQHAGLRFDEAVGKGS